MAKFPNEQPPPYNQFESASITRTQGPPIIQPTAPTAPTAITNQPITKQQQQIVNTIQIVHTGNRCVCRHNFRSEFTCCGICCAIFFFPCGIICCFCMRKQRCRNCNPYA